MQDPLTRLELPDDAARKEERCSLGSRTLHEAEGVVEHPAGPPLSLQSHMHNSDMASRSPWARKILLSLDGGGVRGYSSLLVLEELIRIIERLELGLLDDATGQVQRENKLPFSTCRSSSHYSWARRHDEDEWRSSPDQDLEDVRSKDHASPVTDRQSGGTQDFRVHHYFDYLAGTSTGGLSAIMLSRLQMGIGLALRQYDLVGKKVFSKPRKLSLKQLRRPKYRTKDMNHALQEVISNALPEPMTGQQDKMQRARRSVKLQNDNQYACHTTVISHCSVATNAYMFRSYDHPDPRNGNAQETGDHLNPGPAHDTLLWEAARATSAAPGYFEKVQIGTVDHIDGGLGCNNPARVAFHDITQIHGMQPPILVLSIGTGAPPELQASGSKHKLGKTLDHVKDMFKAFKSSITLATDSEEVHKYLKLLIEATRNNPRTPELHYYRFNVPDILQIDLDEWKGPEGQTTKDVLKQATKDYLARDEVRAQLVECAIELIKLRRTRSATERWEQFATETVYNCTHKHPNNQDVCGSWRPFDSRAKLRQHAFEMHGYVWRVTLDQRNLPSSQTAEETHSSETQSTCLPDDHYLCIWDECGQVQPIVFLCEKDFLDHLKDKHGISEPIIKTRHELEEWLDEGRTTREQLKRQETDLKRKAAEEKERESAPVGS